MNLEKVKVVVIADVGSVHDGSLGNALCLIDVAADCGVDAVKFQTHIPEAETLPDAPCLPILEASRVLNTSSEPALRSSSGASSSNASQPATCRIESQRTYQ